MDDVLYRCAAAAFISLSLYIYIYTKGTTLDGCEEIKEEWSRNC